LPIPASLRAELGITGAATVSGGCIHRCFRVIIAGKLRFLKLNDARHADAFAAEADGLEALSSAGVRAPAPIRTGTTGGQAYLLLAFLDLRASGDYAVLGRMLAALHRAPAERFGWRRDNYIGSTPQENGWCEDWQEFWIERRLRPQLALAARNGFSLSLPELNVLEGHKPKPSLLHGDLWSGNAGFTPQGPVLFDPAVYCGDREADVAMTELFGGFPRAFYRAYEEALPLEAGYEKRKHLYNLYHLLNHLNLFGRGYLGQVDSTLRLLRFG
jgi:fructosamine-3-kinase